MYTNACSLEVVAAKATLGEEGVLLAALEATRSRADSRGVGHVLARWRLGLARDQQVFVL